MAVLHTLVLPFSAAAAVALAAWALGLARYGLAVAPGVLAGFLLGQGLTAGWPALPPVGSVDRLLWLGLAGVGLGSALPALPAGWPRRGALVAALAAAVCWIGWARLSIPQEDAWVAAAVLVLAAWWVAGRLERQSGNGAAAMLAVAAFAAAAIAAFGASYSMAQLVAGLGAAVAGGMAGAGALGLGLGGPGRLTAGAVLLGIVAMLAFYTQAEPLALLLLPPVFLADALVRGFPGAGRIAARADAAGRPGVRLAMTTAFALIPGGLAVAVAYANSGPMYF